MAVRMLVIVIAAALAPGARAQVADHLKCYSGKDPAVAALYTADLAGAGVDCGVSPYVPGCCSPLSCQSGVCQ